MSKSNPFVEEGGPQPPKVLKAPLEVFTNLRQLQESHDPLTFTFLERGQRFQSYLVRIDRERNRIAFDEMIPNDGERFLKNNEPFLIESFHDGVRIVWECNQPVQISELDGARCYWASIPSEITYHQRRNAFRAQLKQTLGVKVELADSKLSLILRGTLLDISATGCKLRIPGDVTSRLQPGQVYDRFLAHLPIGALSTQVELRHMHYEDKQDVSFLGMRFHRISGLEQRLIERFVYQLQRESRRLDE